MADRGGRRLPAAREGVARARARVRALQRRGRIRAPGSARCPRRRSLRLAIAALDRDPERPFFLWVHFFDPHAPYSPPAPHPFGESRADLYDAEILYADRELGRILDALAARDLLRNTAIVVFSDHGEDLVEFDHGTALTEEQIHVPIGIVLPGVPPREVALAVDLTDIAPTVLELVGASSRERMHGQSLLPCVLLDAASRAAFPPTSRSASSEAPGFRSRGSSRRARER